MPEWSAPSRRPLPLILIRGFGGLGVEDEKRIAYQGFNDGTVYPNKRGDNYIYEGMILRFMKSAWQYQDATNVVGYFPAPVVDATARAADLSDLPDDFFYQPPDSAESVRPLYKVVIDPAMALTIRDTAKSRDPLPHAVGVPLLRPERPHVRALWRRAGAADRLHPRAGRAPDAATLGRRRR